MKYMNIKVMSIAMFLLLALLMFLACAGCHRKPRLDPIAEVPDLPSDTVVVTKVISRCNYQYLSGNPKKAKKQLIAAERSLDSLIIEYHPRLVWKGKIASAMIREINKIKRNAEIKN